MAIQTKEKKNLDIAISTPTAGLVTAAYTLCLPRMILYFLQNPVLAQEYSGKRVYSQMRIGSNIGEARDQMVDDAIAKNCTHLLFIDDDMGFAADTLNVALSRQMPVIVGNYRRRMPPGIFTATKKDKDDNVFEIVTSDDKTSLEPCFYGGFGFCLIETEVLKQIEKPRFLMEYQPEIDRYTTEDFPFFKKVHEKGFDVFVDHEVSKRIWHNGTFPYSYEQKLDGAWATPAGERYY